MKSCSNKLIQNLLYPVLPETTTKVMAYGFPPDLPPYSPRTPVWPSMAEHTPSSWDLQLYNKLRIFFLDLFSLCVWVFCPHVCLCTSSMQDPWRTEVGVGSLRNRTTDACQPPCEAWKLNLCPEEKQPLLLTSEPCLQLPKLSFQW